MRVEIIYIMNLERTGKESRKQNLYFIFQLLINLGTLIAVYKTRAF